MSSSTQMMPAPLMGQEFCMHTLWFYRMLDFSLHKTECLVSFGSDLLALLIGDLQSETHLWLWLQRMPIYNSSAILSDAVTIALFYLYERVELEDFEYGEKLLGKLWIEAKLPKDCKAPDTAIEECSRIFLKCWQLMVPLITSWFVYRGLSALQDFMEILKISCASLHSWHSRSVTGRM